MRLIVLLQWTALGVACLAAALEPALACSTFCLRTSRGPFFGKNYDWHIGHGMLVVNPRGVERQALLLQGGDAARWHARFGSVTFNQYGRDFPLGGMNEAGLAVELMWLDGAEYPAPDGRPALGTLQWIQYQLDTASTVADVLASDAVVRIQGTVPLHYLVADRHGAVATVEFLAGRMVAHTGEELPAPALTNSTYAESARYLTALEEGGTETPSGHASLDRFARASRSVRAFRGRSREAAFRYAFSTLDAVAQGPFTKWSIVYDLAGREVRFRTRDLRRVRRLDLDDLDLACGRTAQVLALDRDVAGDVRDLLVDYTYDANRALVGRSFAETEFLAATPSETLDRIARAPDALHCAAAN